MTVHWWQSAKIWKSGVVLFGSLAIGLVSFSLTALTPTYAYLGPLCRQETLREVGFDPWTGQPYGDIYRCVAFPVIGVGQDEERIVTDPVPEDLKGRRAIPLPLGTLLASMGLVGAFAYADRRSTARARRVTLPPAAEGR